MTYTLTDIDKTLALFDISDKAHQAIMKAITELRNSAHESYRLANRLANLSLGIMDCAEELATYSTEDIVVVANDLAFLSGRMVIAETQVTTLLEMAAEQMETRKEGRDFVEVVSHQVWAR